MTSRTRRSILVAAAATMAVVINDHFTTQGIDGPVSLAISAIGAVLFAAATEWLSTELPLRWSWSRRLVDPRAKFEGHWLIHVPEQAERPLALASLQYNRHSGSYLYRGTAFDENGIDIPFPTRTVLNVGADG